MKTLSIDTNKITSNQRVIVLLFLLLLSSVGMFGQEVKNEISIPTTNSQVVISSNTNSQIEFVSWFMGSKQIQISTSVNIFNTISTNNTGKKSYINNGLTPNRILSRAFLKKAVNHGSTIA